ncbi:MAG: nucleotidyltransferase domain-containing protein [Anaerolineae bacterium]
MKRMTRAAFDAKLRQLQQCLGKYQPQKVILFGSFARGDYHAASDVDLLIIKETDLPFLERSAEVWRYCPDDLSLEPLVYTPTEFQAMVARENPLIMQVLREGITIYESES